MGTFETLKGTDANKMPLVESYSLNQGFVCDTVVNISCVVKLLANGKVTPVTAVTDVPFGVVVAANKVVDGKVTIQTFFSAVVTGEAFANTTTGNRLAAKSWDATDLVTVYNVAVTTNYVVGIALSDALANAPVKVGVLRTPFLI